MQAATAFSCSPTLPLFPPFQAAQISCPVTPSFLLSSPIKPLQTYLRAITPLHCTATLEVAETDKVGTGFVEVGYISGVHGLQGEVCVKSNTDFPELRFSQPGRRWLRQELLGKDTYQEVELVEGRGHPGQKVWLLTFEGVDTVDEARLLVGSTVLVREDDRPDLEEGEFYSRDLVGMRVLLKETGEYVGTVVNLYESGAHDLLQVMLGPLIDTPSETEKSKTTERDLSGHLVWVPFVEAIVPDVDMTKREMLITPPKGLLQLNIPVHDKSKKERRQLEWKERKKFQRRLITAKKKLSEMEQKHVFNGLRYGEKSQRSLLADQIIGVNSNLLQQALQSIELPLQRWTVTELTSNMKSKLLRGSLKVPMKCFKPCASEEELGSNSKLLKKGLDLLSKGKIAIVLAVNDIVKGGGDESTPVDSENTSNSLFPSLQRSLCDDETFVKIEDRASVPLVLICPAQEIQSLKALFLENDYFSFDSSKVWFLEEQNLPVVTSTEEEQNKHKILMKSPWEVLQSPIGSGGAFSLLSSHNTLEDLGDIGVEFVQICSASQSSGAWNPLLLGLIRARKSELGIQVPAVDGKDPEECYNMVFSLRFIKLFTKQVDKLQFRAIPKLHSHVELVDKEWIDVVPSIPNSYELHCSIYSSLNACSPDKICVMEVTE